MPSNFYHLLYFNLQLVWPGLISWSQSQKSLTLIGRHFWSFPKVKFKPKISSRFHFDQVPDVWITSILCVNRKTVDLVFCSIYCDRSPLPRLFFPIVTLVQMESQKNKNSKNRNTPVFIMPFHPGGFIRCKNKRKQSTFFHVKQ